MRWALVALTLLAAALTLDAGLAGDAAAAGVGATAITTGGDHNCALLADRTVKCWGANEFGQLGDGTTVRRLTPVPVHGLSNVVSLSAGPGYTCAVVDSGDGTGPVDCWGADNRSIDDPPKALSLLPTPMGGVTNAISVSAGGGIACALLADHTVMCWGENSRGQLGTGTRDASATPTPVPGLAGVQSVDAGDNDVCVVMQAGGTVRCWGWSGRLGPVDQAGDALVPTTVPGITGATEVHADPFNSCVLLPGGTPECWGLSSSSRPRPVRVPTGHVKAYRWSRDGQQTDHSCALLAGGTVRCQSPNPYMGQIGNGTTKPNGDRFVTVSGLRDAVAISVAGFYTCALRSLGGVACWGMNTDGQLGDGTRTTRTRPVAVKGLGAAVRSQAAPAAPLFGKSTTLQAVTGAVRIRLPGTKRFVPLDAATTVPVGTTIDATGGRVRLTTAKDASEQAQSGLFDSGVFRVTQQLVSASAADGQQVGLTVLTLAGPLPACGAGRATLSASAARRRRHGKSRRLWGDAKGRYRTVGKYAAATVLGTRWLTQDQCGGTAVQVARGAVRVDDFVTHKSVLVKAPHRYVAGAQATAGACSRATANRVLEAHGYPREIGLQVTAGVLCGHFVGAGSTAMVATIAHGVCWPFVGWVVLAYESGRWRLVSRGDGQLFTDLPVAVGDGFRETQWMFRKTDTGCNPTRGKRTRVWHWDARRRHLVASAWKTTLAPLNPAEFQVQLAQGWVYCGAAVDDQLVCDGGPTVQAGDFVRQVAILHPGGDAVFCTEPSASDACFQGNFGSPLPTLSFRERSAIGPYTCTVVETGVQCIVTATGKGFLITPTDMTTVGG